MKNKIILWLLIFWILSFGISFAYAPFKSGWTCDFPKSEDPDSFWKRECENEMSFAKFTETTGTRTMSTTCCWYEEHTPETNIMQEFIDNNWWAEKLIKENKFDETISQANEEITKISKNLWQIHDLLMDVIIQIYNKSNDKQKTLRLFSNVFWTCAQKQNNIKVRAVCKELYLDYVWISPKLSKISINDIINLLKSAKQITKRWYQYSDFFEIYSPINHPYSVPNQMYMIWDYAFWLRSAYNTKSDTIDYNGILIMKAWDTHWQEFAKIFLTENSIALSEEFRLWIKNYKLNLYIPIREPNTKENNRLTSQYELQNDWSWKLVWCLNETYKNNNPYEWITQKKINITKCQNLSHVIGVETVLWN